VLRILDLLRIGGRDFREDVDLTLGRADQLERVGCGDVVAKLDGREARPGIDVSILVVRFEPHDGRPALLPEPRRVLGVVADVHALVIERRLARGQHERSEARRAWFVNASPSAVARAVARVAEPRAVPEGVAHDVHRAQLADRKTVGLGEDHAHLAVVDDLERRAARVLELLPGGCGYSQRISSSKLRLTAATSSSVPSAKRLSSRTSISSVRSSTHR